MDDDSERNPLSSTSSLFLNIISIRIERKKFRLSERSKWARRAPEELSDSTRVDYSSWDFQRKKGRTHMRYNKNNQRKLKRIGIASEGYFYTKSKKHFLFFRLSPFSLLHSGQSGDERKRGSGQTIWKRDGDECTKNEKERWEWTKIHTARKGEKEEEKKEHPFTTFSRIIISLCVFSRKWRH